MTPIDKSLWDEWKRAIRSKTTLKSIVSRSDATVFGMVDDRGNQSSRVVSRYRRYSLGLDIVGYTRRSLEGQLFLTTNLLVAIESARDFLRNLGWMALTEPDVTIYTGDGGIMLFESLQSAMAMLFATNMFVEDVNRGPFGGIDPALESSLDFPMLPSQVRYALAVGQVANITVEASTPNAVGPAVSNCARILAASKGSHFLIQDEVMREFALVGGGINEVASLGDPWNWGQQLHAARMAERKIKSGTFAFFNVFGTHKATSFLAAAGRGGGHLVNFGSGDARVYDIGSHDVSSIVP